MGHTSVYIHNMYVYIGNKVHSLLYTTRIHSKKIQQERVKYNNIVRSHHSRKKIQSEIIKNNNIIYFFMYGVYIYHLFLYILSKKNYYKKSFIMFTREWNEIGSGSPFLFRNFLVHNNNRNNNTNSTNYNVV